MITGFEGITATGKVCKDSVKKFDKFTTFRLFIPDVAEGKFITCKVFKKVKEYFDKMINEGDVLTIQATKSTHTYNEKEYIDYICAFIEKK